jgi:hypothetical protein
VTRSIWIKASLTCPIPLLCSCDRAHGLNPRYDIIESGNDSYRLKKRLKKRS